MRRVCSVNPFCLNSRERFSRRHFRDLILDLDQGDSALRAMEGAKSASYASFFEKQDSLGLAIMFSMVGVSLHRTDIHTFVAPSADFVIPNWKEIRSCN